MEVISKVRNGRPDPEHISTSYVERSNLSLRMHLRRFTRLTNAFSKKLDNLKAAVCLWFAFYNFCRVHQTLRVTPAMEAGLGSRLECCGIVRSSMNKAVYFLLKMCKAITYGVYFAPIGAPPRICVLPNLKTANPVWTDHSSGQYRQSCNV
jgi:hypothetical protein